MLTPLRGESMALARFLMHVPGLIVRQKLSFAEIIAPLAVELAPCYWITFIQSGGPFSGDWLSESPRHTEKIERKRFDVPAMNDGALCCWRPHTFPPLAKHVRLDEWSSFWAVRCSDDEAVERLLRFKGDWHETLGDELARTAREADLYLMYPDGWWEIYTRHEDWRRKCQAAFADSFERSWKKAGESPF